MAAKRTPGSRPGLIRCDHCGEEYSESYRRCPFCAEYDADVEYETQRIRAASYGGAGQSSAGPRTAPSRAASSRSSSGRGGKRVAHSNRRGGGYTKISAGKIIAWLLSLIVIIAAIWIIVTQVVPLISKGDNVDPDAMNSPGTSQTPPVDPSPVVSDPTPGTSEPGPSQEPDVSPSPQIPAGDTAAGFTLNENDFSFNDTWPDPITLKVTFSPAGTTAAIHWSSSDPDVASVDANGKVSHGSKRGTATITASMANGVKQTCKVYNRVTSGTAYQPDDDPTPSRTRYKLNKTDFTFYSSGESTKLRVDGYTGTITWSSSNTSVAKVSSDGTVKATGTGKRSCTITATLDDGTKLEAVARISI